VTTSEPERWRRIETLFHQAEALSATRRADFLARACGDDPELRREVESLLAADGGVGRALDEAIARAAGSAVGDPILPRIGAWEVLREIGRGGMGTVYLARRADRAFEQQVAIKVIRGGVADRAQIDRFRAERQILANLDHPAIARLLDGGATDDGLPYLVMEYLEGEPIDRWCDQRCLPIAARLELFLRVCDAVQYAHQNLVVHRDIKPSNILVTAHGAPKLLDFGIAKLLDPAGGQSLALTGSLDRLLTPDFASPEQVRGTPVTTRTDVYALGLLLYLLLTGSRRTASAARARRRSSAWCASSRPPRRARPFSRRRTGRRRCRRRRRGLAARSRRDSRAACAVTSTTSCSRPWPRSPSAGTPRSVS